MTRTPPRPASFVSSPRLSARSSFCRCWSVRLSVCVPPCPLFAGSLTMVTSKKALKKGVSILLAQTCSLFPGSLLSPSVSPPPASLCRSTYFSLCLSVCLRVECGRTRISRGCRRCHGTALLPSSSTGKCDVISSPQGPLRARKQRRPDFSFLHRGIEECSNERNNDRMEQSREKKKERKQRKNREKEKERKVGCD